MATLVTNDVIEVALVSNAASQAGIVVRHFLVGATTGGSVTDLEAAEELNTNYRVLFRNLMSVAATWLGVRLARIFPLPRTAPAVSVTGSAAGNVLGDILPKQTAGVITLQTQFAGRKFRGRAYIPFPSETSSGLNGTPVVTYLTDLIALALQMRSFSTVVGGIGTANLHPIIWHRATQTNDLITASRANAVWGTQRRRGDYGRPNPAVI